MPHRREQLEEAGCVLATHEPVPLMSFVRTSGEIPRKTSFERPEEFQTLRDGRVERDDVCDDQALFIHLPDAGLVVLTGCAHAGIVNTVQYGLELTGASRLAAVIGGFHLLRATPDRVAKTVEALHMLEPEVLAPLHCTGDQATAELSRAFGDRLHYAHVGSEFHFKSGHPTAP